LGVKTTISGGRSANAARVATVNGAADAAGTYIAFLVAAGDAIAEAFALVLAGVSPSPDELRRASARPVRMAHNGVAPAAISTLPTLFEEAADFCCCGDR